MAGWRYFTIGPTKHPELSRVFYAPDLNAAFHHARLTWGSRTLTCFGSKKERSTA